MSEEQTLSQLLNQMNDILAAEHQPNAWAWWEMLHPGEMERMNEQVSQALSYGSELRKKAAANLWFEFMRDVYTEYNVQKAKKARRKEIEK